MPSYIRKPIITHDEEKRQQPKVILLFGSHHIIVLPSTLTTTTGLMLVLLAAYSIEPSTILLFEKVLKECSISKTALMFWLDALQGLTLIFQVLLCYFFQLHR